MKTEKEKAEELVMQFMKLIPKDGWTQEIHKQCALICVDEIRKSCLSYDYNLAIDANYYWNNVEEEIRKL
jgi:hypothetical protein